MRFLRKFVLVLKKKKKPGVMAYLFMLRRQRQVGYCMFKASLIFIASSKLSRAAVRTQKQNKQKGRKTK